MASARTKLLELFQANIGVQISQKQLRRVAVVSDWPRVVRALRQEGYQIEHIVKDHSYVMHAKNKIDSGKKRFSVDQKTRYRILQRDLSKCQRCGRTISDGVKLAIDHKIPVEWGGKTRDENLWVLCEECNLGKKHWFNDQDSEKMKILFEIVSGSERLETFIRMHPNELLDPTTLALISGIRDWTRTLRLIRKKEDLVIKYVKKNKMTGKEGYILKT